MNWFKRGLKRYDDWCKQMGLTPDQNAAASLIEKILPIKTKRRAKLCLF